MTSRQVALAFVEAINAQDLEGMFALMTPDHEFVDTYGDRQSREDMVRGWPGYFAWFPDYRIQVEQVMEDGDTVGLFGFASGTYQGRQTPDHRFRYHLPAVWRVTVEGELVRVWQVFCDSKIPYELMET